MSSREEDIDLIRKVRQDVLDRTIRETGWSPELAEARGLSPSEWAALETVWREEILAPGQEDWAKQLEIWGLVTCDDGRWRVTNRGVQVAEIRERDDEDE